MGGSKYLERMAREAIVRSDKAQRREDTGAKYPTELERCTSERGRASQKYLHYRSCRRSAVLRTTLMHPYLRNALAALADLVAGSTVNMGLIYFGGHFEVPLGSTHGRSDTIYGNGKSCIQQGL